MQKKSDVRQKRTKIYLRDALIELLKIKTMDKVTINEVLERSFVSRGTFYFHYENKEDFIQNVIDDMFNEMFSRIDEAKEPDCFHLHKGAIVARNTLLLTFIAEHADFFKVMLGENGSRLLIDRWHDIGLTHFKSKYRNLIISNPDKFIHKDLIANYIVSGQIETVRFWLKTDMKLSPTFVANILAQLTHAVINAVINSDL